MAILDSVGKSLADRKASVRERGEAQSGVRMDVLDETTNVSSCGLLTGTWNAGGVAISVGTVQIPVPWLRHISHQIFLPRKWDVCTRTYARVCKNSLHSG